MCRAEAHKLYARKPIFDALGIQLYAVLHEHIEAEVCSELLKASELFSFLSQSLTQEIVAIKKLNFSLLCNTNIHFDKFLFVEAR